MERSIAEAAEYLGLDPSRVRTMVRTGQLRGRRLGRAWLIDAQHLSEVGQASRHRGRPLTPARAWAAIDLLAGGTAPWLSTSARTHVLRVLRAHGHDDGDRWAALLRTVANDRRMYTHPSQLAAIREDVRAINADIDAPALGLVVLAPTHEFFVDAADWPRFESDYWLSDVGNLEQSNVRLLTPRDSNAASVLARPAGRALAASVIHLGSLDPRVRSASGAHLRDAWAYMDAGGTER